MKDDLKSAFLERFKNDAKKLKKVGEPWIHSSYVEFLNYFKNKKSLSSHDFIISAYFTYGWMPTIPNIKGDFNKLAKICSKCLPSPDIEEITDDDLKFLVSSINNSLVGASKLLHFINPEKYAIWDSRVYRYLFGLTAHDSRLHDINLYKEYLNLLSDISNDPSFNEIKENIEKLIEEKPKNGFSDFRIIELVFFTLGSNSLSEIGSPLASKLTNNDCAWPKYQLNYLPCVLDATANWYEKVGAEDFFKEWIKDSNTNINTSTPPDFINDQHTKVSARLKNQNGILDWEPFDALAWYYPASLPEVNGSTNLCVLPSTDNCKYGIHFCLDKMKRACHYVIGYPLKNTLKDELWLGYLAFFQMVLAHEYCHAWVEDIVLASELLVLRDTKDYYKNKLHETKGYIEYEEAICNTVAYGWLNHFLATTTLSFERKEEIKKQIVKFMKSQPRGYNDFSEIKTLPIKDSEFLGIAEFSKNNIIKLVTETYFPKNKSAVLAIKKIIFDYFDYSTKKNISKVKDVNLVPGNPEYRAPMLGKMWKAPVPIYFH